MKVGCISENNRMPFKISLLYKSNLSPKETCTLMMELAVPLQFGAILKDYISPHFGKHQLAFYDFCLQ
jgi:hypothetical protein